jgi:hypothetical protein
MDDHRGRLFRFPLMIGNSVAAVLGIDVGAELAAAGI